MVYVYKPARRRGSPPKIRESSERPPRNPKLRPGAHEFNLRFTVTLPRGAVGTTEDLLQALVTAFNGKQFRLLGQWFQVQLADATLTHAPTAQPVPAPAGIHQEVSDGTV